jgi:hypothetical protein
MYRGRNGFRSPKRQLVKPHTAHTQHTQSHALKQTLSFSLSHTPSHTYKHPRLVCIHFSTYPPVRVINTTRAHATRGTGYVRASNAHGPAICKSQKCAWTSNMHESAMRMGQQYARASDVRGPAICVSQQCAWVSNMHEPAMCVGQQYA